MGHRLLLFIPRSSLLKPAISTPSSLCQAIKCYSMYKDDDDDDDDDGDRAIGEKARSTAEEFSRVAKEKAAAVRRSQTIDAAFDGLAAQVGESDYEEAKKKLRETIDKGAQEKTSKE